MAQYKDIAKKILYHGGYYSLRERFRLPSEPRLLILMYHNVVADEDQRLTWRLRGTPTESQFAAVLTALKKHYRVISVEDAVREIRDTGELKERSVAITLDDGCLSTYSTVFPILKSYGVTATVYPHIDWIDGKLIPWWLTLAEMIDQCDLTRQVVAKVETVLGKSVGVEAHTLRVPDDARWALLVSVQWNLMRRDEETRGRIIEELRGCLPIDRQAFHGLHDPMTWEQIRKMSAKGIQFGAHTCSHPNLSHVSLEAAAREIVESKRIIEGHLGAEVTGFAYPYGYDVAGYQKLKPMLENSSFAYACTSWPDYVDSESDLYRLGRISMPNSSSPAIVARALSLDYCLGKEQSTVLKYA